MESNHYARSSNYAKLEVEVSDREVRGTDRFHANPASALDNDVQIVASVVPLRWAVSIRGRWGLRMRQARFASQRLCLCPIIREENEH